ncbi:MAG: rRNA maturation RNase YbeY [Gammaproteobacteria bacterium]
MAEVANDGLVLDLQVAVKRPPVPGRELFERAVRAALGGRRERAELALRVVGRAEARSLNQRFRGKGAPTNVLSFPAEGLGAIAPDLLGDIAICAPLVVAEARAAGKSVEAHWTHLVVHGVLHLLGHDHVEAAAATAMEDLERTILAELGYPDPYGA